MTMWISQEKNFKILRVSGGGDKGKFYRLYMSCPVCGTAEASDEWAHCHDCERCYLEINEYGLVRCNSSFNEKHSAPFSQWRWNCKGYWNKNEQRTENPHTAEIGSNDKWVDRWRVVAHKSANPKYVAPALSKIIEKEVYDINRN
eukprot:820983_1